MNQLLGMPGMARGAWLGMPGMAHQKMPVLLFPQCMLVGTALWSAKWKDGKIFLGMPGMARRAWLGVPSTALESDTKCGFPKFQQTQMPKREGEKKEDSQCSERKQEDTIEGKRKIPSKTECYQSYKLSAAKSSVLVWEQCMACDPSANGRGT